jgi:hypothetical protein
MSDDLVQRIARRFRVFEPAEDEETGEHYFRQRTRPEIISDVLPLLFAEMRCVDCDEPLVQKITNVRLEEIEFHCPHCDTTLMKVRM